jgi:hypothetical protein
MSLGKKVDSIRPEFVTSVPDQLEDGVLYISERFRICSHKCCCGCGEEVVTPLSPAEWKLTREGEFVSLWPSVGNWDYACRSHYVIRRNRVLPAPPMTERQIARVQQRDAADLSRMVASSNAAKTEVVSDHGPSAMGAPRPPDTTLFSDLVRLWRSLWRIFFGD